MEIIDIIVPIAAIWGALLSTSMLILKLYENKVKIKVDYENYVLEIPNEKPTEYYTIVAKNLGSKPVTMAYAYIALENYPSEKWHNLVEDGATGEDRSINGKQISSGQSIKAEFEYPADFSSFVTPKTVGNTIMVIGYFIDQVGNYYKSEPFEIDDKA
ncbi:MAG: hypothetical protein NTZ39_04155 [Methanoregula sp.]|nr:hypothetical protein [Methanoregula sp.]